MVSEDPATTANESIVAAESPGFVTDSMPPLYGYVICFLVLRIACGDRIRNFIVPCLFDYTCIYVIKYMFCYILSEAGESYSVKSKLYAFLELTEFTMHMVCRTCNGFAWFLENNG